MTGRKVGGLGGRIRRRRGKMLESLGDIGIFLNGFHSSCHGWAFCYREKIECIGVS